MSAGACPPTHDLEAFPFDVAVRERLAGHVAACARCAAELERVRANEEFLDQLRELRRSDPARRGPVRVKGLRLVSPIGRGGQGEVWEARETATGERVALKVLPVGAAATTENRRRFEREIDLVARLRHPGIVTVHGRVECDDGRPALVMELVGGVDLHHHLEAARAAGRPPDLAARLKLFLAIADAVQYAHDRGVLHRDLKPANVVVDHEGRPRVVDFGLAKRIEAGLESAELTATGQFLGSLAWSAPEQIRSEHAFDARTDVYALGALLDFLLTEARPFEDEPSLGALVHAVLTREPEAPSRRAVVAGVGPGHDAVVLRALEKEPRRRYRSAAALAQDVRRLRAGRRVAARRRRSWSRLTRAVRSRTAAVVALFALAAAAGVAYRSRDASAAGGAGAERVRMGRLLAQRGDVAQAEEILWREHLADERTETAWALWDLYRRDPCLDTRSVGGVGPFLLSASPAACRVAVYDEGASRLELLDGPVSRSLDLPGTGIVHDLTFTPDRAAVLLLTESGLVHVDLDRGGARVLPLADGGIRMSFGPDDRALVANRRGDLFELVGREPSLVPFGAVPLAAGETLSGLAWMSDRIVASGYSLLSRPFPSDRPTWRRFDPEDVHGALVGRSPSRWLVTDDFGLLLFWDMSSDPPGLTMRMAGNPDGPTSYSCAGSVLAFVRGESIAVVSMDEASGEIRDVARLHGHASTVTDLEFCAGGSRLVSVDGDGVVKTWEVVPAWRRSVWGEDGGRPPDLRGTAHAVAWAADGSRLFAGTSVPTERRVGEAPRYTGALRVLDATDWGSCGPPVGLRGVVSAVAPSPVKPEQVAFGTYEGPLLCYDAARRLVTGSAPGSDGVDYVAWSRDGRWLASAHRDGFLRIWDAEELRPVDVVASEAPEVLSATAWDHRSRWVAASRRDGRVLWYDRQTRRAHPSGEGHRSAGGPAAARCVAASPTDALVATGGDGGRVLLWRTAEERPSAALDPGGAPVFSVAFSPDGRLLASGGAEGRVHLWDVDSGALLCDFAVAPAGIYALAFGPRDRLAVGGRHGLLEVVDTAWFERHVAGNRAAMEAALGRATRR